MTLGELRSALRVRLDDTVMPYLWPDGVLDSYLNQAVNEACLRADLIIDSTTPDVGVIETTPGVASYDIHASVYFLEDVSIGPRFESLVKLGVRDLRTLHPDWQTAQGVPVIYATDLTSYSREGLAHTLRLYPTPDAVYELALTAHRVPLEPLTDSDAPEIPARLHMDLLHWAAHLAYMTRDVDTIAYERAMFHADMFERAFGPIRSAEWAEERRKKYIRRVQSHWF